MLDQSLISDVEVVKDTNTNTVTVSFTMPPHRRGAKIIRIDNKTVLNFVKNDQKLPVTRVLSGCTVNNDYADRSDDYVAKGTWVFELEAKQKPVAQRKPVTQQTNTKKRSSKKRRSMHFTPTMEEVEVVETLNEEVEDEQEES